MDRVSFERWVECYLVINAPIWVATMTIIFASYLAQTVHSDMEYVRGAFYVLCLFINLINLIYAYYISRH